MPASREELITRHIPLARRLAGRYARSPEPSDDLIQVACLGLVKAADRWDPGRGFAFSSYAVPTILGELRRYFRDATWAVRPPRELQELCMSVVRARDELQAATGHEPTIPELALRLGRPREDVAEALLAAEGRSARSLDLPIPFEDEPATAGDLIGCHDSGYARAEARATLERLLPVLDERAREILRLRFEDGALQRDIAARVGCSQMHVSRIIRASLETLQAAC
jgi:RNA polymerase sigma-B factor